MSMATRSSDLDDQKPGINIQTEDHTLTLTSGWNGHEDPEIFSSIPSHLPSQSPARKPTPNKPETWYCMEILVTLTKDGTVTPLPPHAWHTPVMEDMVQDGTSSLTEAIVTGPGRAILFYGQQSLGEGPSLGEV